MTALVFGEADPRDYWEPLCRCGHARAEHYDSDGTPPTGSEADVSCWADWEGDKEGCECLRWTAAER